MVRTNTRLVVSALLRGEQYLDHDGESLSYQASLNDTATTLAFLVR